METVTIGTCTADEQETLDKLLHLGITASTTADTDNILPEDITPSSDPPASEIEMDRSVLDIPESTPQPSTSSASTSGLPIIKVKPKKTKLPVKLSTLDDNPPVDIPLPSDIELDKSGDTETRLEEPAFIEELKYMKLDKTYIKNDLHVSLTRLTNDEIQQKTRRKPIKTCHKAIAPRPVTVKANPTAARKYIFKLKRYGVRHKNHKNYHHTCMGKKCHAVLKSL